MRVCPGWRETRPLLSILSARLFPLGPLYHFRLQDVISGPHKIAELAPAYAALLALVWFQTTLRHLRKRAKRASPYTILF